MNYLFAKVRLTWGSPLFDAHVGDEGTVRIAKRDWAEDILRALNCRPARSESPGDYLRRVRDRIDRIFSEIRSLVDDDKRRWRYPSLREVVAYMAHWQQAPAHRQYRPERLLEDAGARQRARNAGASALADMKSLFGGRA